MVSDCDPELAQPALAALEQRLQPLPLLPTVVAEVLTLDPEADDYFDRLLRLAEVDPAFAVRVLRCANSAFSAPLTPIVSLREAFTRIGTEKCAGLVLAMVVIKLFVPRSESQRLQWVHSLQTAMFARMFSRWVRDLPKRGDQAYLCGLVHDIGRFVQFECAPDDIERVAGSTWTSPDELVSAERSTLGYDHTQLGWHACVKWSLPAVVAEVVRHHHDDLQAAQPGTHALVRVVQWADRLSMAMMNHPERAAAAPADVVEWLVAEFADLGPAAATDDETPWQVYVPGVHAESMNLARQIGLL